MYIQSKIPPTSPQSKIPPTSPGLIWRILSWTAWKFKLPIWSGLIYSWASQKFKLPTSPELVLHILPWTGRKFKLPTSPGAFCRITLDWLEVG